MKRDLVDSKVMFMVGQEPDQWLPNGPGPDDVDDVHVLSPRVLSIKLALIRGLGSS
jgi:hypothetical protein